MTRDAAAPAARLPNPIMELLPNERMLSRKYTYRRPSVAPVPMAKIEGRKRRLKRGCSVGGPGTSWEAMGGEWVGRGGQQGCSTKRLGGQAGQMGRTAGGPREKGGAAHVFGRVRSCGGLLTSAQPTTVVGAA